MNEHLSSQKLTDLAEGLLPPAHREAVEGHLAGCPRCREALAARQALVGRLRQGLHAYLERVTPPPTLRWEGVRDRVPRQRGPKRSMTMWRRMRTAAASLAVFTLSIGLVLGLSALFRQMASPASPGEEIQVVSGPVVEMAGQLPAGNGPFGFQSLTITVRAALPQVPDSVPLYRVESVLQNISPQDVRQWAERLGMGPVRVYQQDEEGMMMMGQAGYVGLTEDWETLNLSTNLVSFGGNAFSPWRLFGTGASSEAMVDEATARVAAEAFLDRLAPYLITVEGATELPQVTFSLTADEDIGYPGTGIRGYRVEPVLNGVHIVVEGGIGNIILVGPEGQISEAFLTPLRLTPTGEMVNPRPPEAVLSDFIDGESGLLRGSGWSSGGTSPGERPQVFQRSLTYREGEQITVVGWMECMRGVEGEADLILLHSFDLPYVFILEGADVTESPASQTIQVAGTLRGAETPHVWRLQVERLKTGDPPGSLRVSWEGEVQRREDGLRLKTREGQEFLLPDPPEDLPDGAQVSVMGMPAAEDSNRLEWSVIGLLPEEEAVVPPPPPTPPPGLLPPADDATPTPTPSMPTPVLLPPADDATPTAVTDVSLPSTFIPVPPPPPASATLEGDAVAPPPLQATPTPVAVSVERVVVPAQPAPDPASPSATPPTWWSYQIGDEVTLEGLLYVHGYRLPDGTTQVYAGLTVQEPPGKEGIPYLPLVGDRLVELLPLDQLHVRVRGQILGEEEAAEKMDGRPLLPPFGQVLWVEDVEQLWPEETKNVYNGPVRIESVEGQEVALLDDQISGRTFALPAEMITLTWQTYQENTPLTLIGVLEPGKEIGGYPALRIGEMRFGEGQVEPLRERLENPLEEITPGEAGPTEVVIEEVKLAYEVTVFFPQESPEETGAEPVATEPVYLLIGHSPDGQYRVTFRLQVTGPSAQP